MYLRVAVRSVEAWLLADREAIGRMLGVSVARIPPNPDSLAAPKQTLVDLARRARRRTVREDMVPRPGSGRSEGPAYASRIIEFADRSWRPALAQNASNSLCRCLTALRKMCEEPMIDS